MRDLKPTPLNAIRAHCRQCLGYYADGIQDCENRVCPLYTWMPRRALEPDMAWIRYHPLRKGQVLRSEISTEGWGNPEGLEAYRRGLPTPSSDKNNG